MTKAQLAEKDRDAITQLVAAATLGRLTRTQAEKLVEIGHKALRERPARRSISHWGMHPG